MSRPYTRTYMVDELFQERNKQILHEYLLKSVPVEDLAAQYYITRQRVYQILEKQGLDTKLVRRIEAHARFQPTPETIMMANALEEIGLKRCYQCKRLKRESEFHGNWKKMGRCSECNRAHAKSYYKGRTDKNLSQPYSDLGVLIDHRKTDTKADKIRLMVAQGMRNRDIAKVLECSPVYVSKVKASSRK